MHKIVLGNENMARQPTVEEIQDRVRVKNEEYLLSASARGKPPLIAFYSEETSTLFIYFGDSSQQVVAPLVFIFPDLLDGKKEDQTFSIVAVKDL